MCYSSVLGVALGTRKPLSKFPGPALRSGDYAVPGFVLIEINVGVLVLLDYATTTWLLVEIKTHF
jgi:hypothetical protein